MVLRAFSQQTDREFRVIVADDGSDATTKAVVTAAQADFLYGISHVWQEDEGFRAAAIRNKAILATDADYIIFTDGDCVPRPHFMAAHKGLAERGWFVAGNRILLSQRLTDTLLKDGKSPPIWTWSLMTLLRSRMRADINSIVSLIRAPLGWSLRKLTKARWVGVKTCNLAVWRTDLEAINGFEESYVGWGFEDSDLVIRLLRYGIRHKSGRWAAPVFHLWHKENDRSHVETNLARMHGALAEDSIEAKRGLSSHGDRRTLEAK